MRRRQLPLTLLPLCLLFPFGASEPIRAQDGSARSIHQIQSEAYRDFTPAPAPGPRRPTPSRLPSVPGLSRTVFGFYPYWASGYAQIRFETLTHLAYFSVEADASGGLVNLRGWPNTALVDVAHGAGVKVVLVCTLFNQASLGSLLASGTARQTLIDNLKQQVLAGGADGVNVDFEGVPGGQRQNLVEFMRDLASVLRAAVPGAHISIDTPAVDWSNAFDYAALADICDGLMIMCYDYYWRGGSHAGPVSPLRSSPLWGNYSVEWTIADYLTKVGPSRAGRLIMGVPYYGYDWPTQDDQLRSAATASATARTFAVAAERAIEHGRRWDPISSTPWYYYLSPGPRQCWYDNEVSLSAKYDLVFLNSLQGIGIWALGYDGARTELRDLILRRFSLPVAPDPPGTETPSAWFERNTLPVSVRPAGPVAVSSFEVAVGSTPGGTDVRDFQSIGDRQQALVRGLALSDGRTYHVTSRSVGAGGEKSAPGNSSAVRIDTSIPVTTRYIPHWVSSTWLYTGLALMNGSSATQGVAIRGRIVGEAGEAAAGWVLRPGTQVARLVSQPELLGPQAFGREGWLEVRSSLAGPSSMYLIGDTEVRRTLAGSPLLPSAVDLVLPELDDGAAAIWIANPGARDATVRLELNRTDGTRTSRVIQLAAGAISGARVADYFPETGGTRAVPAGQRTPFIRLESDVPVACTTNLDRGGDAATLPALPAAGGLKSGLIPYVAYGSGYGTSLVLANVSNTPSALELRLLGGTAAIVRTLTIPPSATVRADVAELFQPAGESQGGVVTFRVAQGEGILASAWIHSQDYRSMAALIAGDDVSTRHTFAHLAQAQGYWTGLSIGNPGTDPATVTVEAFDATGSRLGSHNFLLPPGEVTARLVFQWIPETLGANSGRVEVRADRGVTACEIFGSDTLSFMAAIPPENRGQATVSPIF